MLEEITKNPDLANYLISFKEGDIIFLEGDDSQDLYVLLFGRIDILKGNKKISEISEEGSLFGEMSSLLGIRRSATAKACTEVEALCIPQDKLSGFLRQFPTVSDIITRLLAQRLDETSQALFGLKEFCDQLPDAVVVTDRDGKTLTWNTAAEKLYGRDWHQMHDKSLEEIYDTPQEYRNFLEEVQSRYSVREKILKIKHPELGTRFVSTSTTVLYDGHHNFHGLLSLGRDVTAVKKLEHRYSMAKIWLIPFLILLVIAGAAFYIGYPHFLTGSQAVDVRKEDLRNQMAKDYLLLKSLLLDAFVSADRAKRERVMTDFLKVQEETESPYKGLVLLDKTKRVFDAVSIKGGGNARDIVGHSYAGIEFQGSDTSAHRVLVVYRTDKEHPTGHKGTEIAFEIQKGNQLLGWLVFQMDMEALKKTYNADDKDLKRFTFKKF